MAAKSIREQIVEWLMIVEKEHTYVQLLLKDVLQEFEAQDKAFITEIVYGTVKYQIQLDFIINQYSKIKVNKMKPLIRNLLRMSVYQIMYLDKIPDSATINEAVKIIHRRKMSNLSGFVNGVLRNITRNKENIVYPSKQTETIKYLSVFYSMPEWIVRLWIADYGIEKTEQICNALNDRAKVSIRVNLMRTSVEKVKLILQEEKVQVEEGELLHEALYLRNTSAINHLQSFKDGLWTVQDESAMLVAHVVDPTPGEIILDMCSAPGGKTMHMAEMMKNQGEIISTDIHPHKIELIAEYAKRMRMTCVKPKLQDGTQWNNEWEEKFDKVLLDAPCLGLGILKRKPDIRYNRKETDVEGIQLLQKRLLDCASRYVKKGGILVYSTCSISKIENDEMLAYAKKCGLELEDIAPYIPEILKNEIVEKGAIQIFPFQAGTDGFFIARFRKRG